MEFRVFVKERFEKFAVDAASSLSPSSAGVPASATKGRSGQKVHDIPKALMEQLVLLVRKILLANPLIICIGQKKKRLGDVNYSHSLGIPAIEIMRRAFDSPESDLSFDAVVAMYEPLTGVMSTPVHMLFLTMSHTK